MEPKQQKPNVPITAHGDVSKPITPTLRKMGVGDEEEFRSSSFNTLKNAFYKIGLIDGRKFSYVADKDSMTIRVTRVA